MKSKKLIVRIIENWPAKVLSIALALMLFVFHRISTTATRPLSVPLSIETGAALIPASPHPQSVRIQLRGDDNGIRAIADGDIEAFADFSRYENAGMYRAPVQIRKKGSALDVEPLEITVNPMEISIHLDHRIVKTLPVSVDVRGSVAPGFDLVSHAIVPSEILAVGPEGILGGIAEIRTDPVILEGRNGDFHLAVNIINPNPYIVLQGSGLVEFNGVIRSRRIIDIFSDEQ